ncbi:MAG: MgtC/SapB family protein [Thermoleophilia bacterium]|nr:MgtC/SapB family protein [Thermoleophilia bacterium]
MSILDLFIRILVAAVLGGVVGIEREIREHTAGFRTHILVALGAAAFTLASSYGLQGTGYDPNRISAQVVTGIGFLGAGAIIRYGVSVRGLTTAASLWAVAAVGLLTAQGYFSAALITTAMVIVSLYVLRVIEEKLLYPRIGKEIGLRVQFRDPGFTPLAQLFGVLQQAHVVVKEMAVEQGEDASDTIHLYLKLPRNLNATTLTALITDLREVRSVRID